LKIYITRFNVTWMSPDEQTDAPMPRDGHRLRLRVTLCSRKILINLLQLEIHLNS